MQENRNFSIVWELQSVIPLEQFGSFMSAAVFPLKINAQVGLMSIAEADDRRNNLLLSLSVFQKKINTNLLNSHPIYDLPQRSVIIIWSNYSSRPHQSVGVIPLCRWWEKEATSNSNLLVIVGAWRSMLPAFMEGLQNALNDRGLTVTILPEKGRSLFTTRNFHPGEEIISQEPYVCVPNNSTVESRCDRCFASINLKKCSACKVAWYCSSTCQKSEWKLHRLECDALARLDKDRHKSVTPSIRLIIKLFIRRKLQSEKVIPTTATDNYKLVEALIDHMSGIDEKQLVLYAQMGTLVNLILQWPEMNVKEIARHFSKLACNAHTICDSELRPLGTGLYPVISIINHSCLPNAVLVFEGRSAVVRAVQHIPAGAEVSISYIETAGSTMTRQKALKENYLFTCTCSRCVKVVTNNCISQMIKKMKSKKVQFWKDTGAKMTIVMVSCFVILMTLDSHANNVGLFEIRKR
ncbi:Histone-lysine N-methyltransferase ASHR1, partial [Cucurbita argyrosperma subsp. sororia]